MVMRPLFSKEDCVIKNFMLASNEKEIT